MKFTEALAERKLKISDLPKSQQRKVFDLLKLNEKLEKINEEDVEEEEKEKIASFRSQVEEADVELVKFISSFDLEKAMEQRERLAKMREKNGKGVKKEPPVEPTPLSGTIISANGTGAVSVSVTEETKAASVQEQPQPKVEEAKVVSLPPVPPVREGEQTIEKHIEQLKREAEIKPESYEQQPQPQPQEPQPQQLWDETNNNTIILEAEEFEKKGERKPKKLNIPLVVMGVGALILTWGAVNFFKERK